MQMYLQKVISRNFFLNLRLEGQRRQWQDPDPDPLVRGTDPQIRIRVSTKLTRIRYTGIIKVYT